MSMVKPAFPNVLYDLQSIYCVRVIVLRYIAVCANACIVSVWLRPSATPMSVSQMAERQGNSDKLGKKGKPDLLIRVPTRYGCDALSKRCIKSGLKRRIAISSSVRGLSVKPSTLA